MEDYTSNSKKSKEQPTPKATEKVVEKVVVGEVTVQKKTLGRKIKDVVAQADFKGSTNYVIAEVLIPAARNMFLDSITKGAERLVGGNVQPRPRYGTGTRVTMYNSPIHRGPREIGPTRRPPIEPRTRRTQADYILASRDEADLVLERLNDIIDNYDVASVADLNDLLGMPTTYTDNKYGWVYLGDTQIRQIREGYLLDLPPAEPISNTN